MLKSKVIYELHFLQESKWLRMKQTIILNVLEGTMRTIYTDQSISWVPGKKNKMHADLHSFGISITKQ